MNAEERKEYIKTVQILEWSGNVNTTLLFTFNITKQDYISFMENITDMHDDCHLLFAKLTSKIMQIAREIEVFLNFVDGRQIWSPATHQIQYQVRSRET